MILIATYHAGGVPGCGNELLLQQIRSDGGADNGAWQILSVMDFSCGKI